MASIHETAEGLHAVGVMDKRTMRRLNEACLTPVHPLTPEEIRALREREGASQAVFARYLNVTTGLGSQWERGEKRRLADGFNRHDREAIRAYKWNRARQGVEPTDEGRRA